MTTRSWLVQWWYSNSNKWLSLGVGILLIAYAVFIFSDMSQFEKTALKVTAQIVSTEKKWFFWTNGSTRHQYHPVVKFQSRTNDVIQTIAMSEGNDLSDIQKDIGIGINILYSPVNHQIVYVEKDFQFIRKYRVGWTAGFGLVSLLWFATFFFQVPLKP